MEYIFKATSLNGCQSPWTRVNTRSKKKKKKEKKKSKGKHREYKLPQQGKRYLIGQIVQTNFQHSKYMCIQNFAKLHEARMYKTQQNGDDIILRKNFKYTD